MPRKWLRVRGRRQCLDAARDNPSEDLSVMASRLRVYYGPPAEARPPVSKPKGRTETVSVPLSEILPMLADAVESNRTWLSDFGDDEVTISNDLYEVILAYQHYRRPSA
jgi:hypothetical protein